MQVIITAAVGRNGSQNLVDIFNRFGKSCIAEHEPPDLPLRRLGYKPFFRRRGWLGPGSRFAMIGRDFQRRFLAPDELVGRGRGRALTWLDAGRSDKIAGLAARRVDRIRRFERRGYLHYIEAGPYFLRTFADDMRRLMPDLRLIKLTRDPVLNAKSFVNRRKDIFKIALPPDRPSNLLRIQNWRDFSEFQLYLHLWFEAELRFYDFVERYKIARVLKIETPDLGKKQAVEGMFRYFGIEHREIGDLTPTNTAQDHHRERTRVTEQDIDEYEAFLEQVPDHLLDRIEYLKTFDPRKGVAHAAAKS